MKQSAFIVILFVLAMVVGYVIYSTVFGADANFVPGTDKEKSVNVMGMIYTGGPLIALLIALSIMDLAIVIERFLSLKKAQGKKAVQKFFTDVLGLLRNNKVDEALKACDAQRGSVANIIKAALTRYKEVTSENIDKEKQLGEVQRSVEEALLLETPLLEKNLIALSTIASIATMVGLLGTVIGMIRSFSALAHSGSVDALQLATGISEALFNTAGGLIVAIIGIVAYNFFTNKVDNFTFQVDEASYNVMQLLKSK
jgi:biopolymer transport protein ExbB